MTQRLHIEVTEEMVRAFARLTGDFNSLHTDRSFGRRSGFRQNIVHGMLPLLFLAVVPEQPPANRCWSITSLSARFIKPIFVQDKIVLNTRTSDAAGDDLRLAFEIIKGDSNTVVSDGFLVLSPVEKSSVFDQAGGGTSHESMVDGRLEERSFRFEDLHKGDTAQVLYRLLPEHVVRLQRLLAAGAVDGELGLQDDRWLASFDLARLLSTTMLSTLIGMQMPGRYATFVDFHLDFEDSPQFGDLYELVGTVKFASASAETIIVGVASSPAGAESGTRPIFGGKATVKVNAPPKVMPSVETLQEEAVDLGLRDKVLLVTGGSRGIGETVAKLFAVHGAQVAVNYLHGQEDAERVVSEIRRAGGRAIACQADVSDWVQVRDMAGQIRQQFGTVDILVNNAVSDYFPVDFLELCWNDIQKDIDVVLKGAFNCCRAVVPMMIEAGAGRIINMGTVATDVPPPKQLKYVVVKSALMGLTKSLAVELAGHNIQVNAVTPSLVETDLTAYMPRLIVEQTKGNTPMQRNARPIDVAKAVLFLASSMSSFSTGQRIVVSGGNPPFL